MAILRRTCKLQDGWPGIILGLNEIHGKLYAWLGRRLDRPFDILFFIENQAYPNAFDIFKFVKIHDYLNRNDFNYVILKFYTIQLRIVIVTITDVYYGSIHPCHNRGVSMRSISSGYASRINPINRHRAYPWWPPGIDLYTSHHYNPRDFNVYMYIGYSLISLLLVSQFIY